MVSKKSNITIIIPVYSEEESMGGDIGTIFESKAAGIYETSAIFEVDLCSWGPYHPLWVYSESYG